ncbi:hypothetical protein GCM10009700_15770 [Brevibacterium sanguinis]
MRSPGGWMVTAARGVPSRVRGVADAAHDHPREWAGSVMRRASITHGSAYSSLAEVTVR